MYTTYTAIVIKPAHYLDKLLSHLKLFGYHALLLGIITTDSCLEIYIHFQFSDTRTAHLGCRARLFSHQGHLRCLLIVVQF
jgi:hypothetical protein